MPLGSGFAAGGPFGLDEFGRTNFARKIILENLPTPYVEADLVERNKGFSFVPFPEQFPQIKTGPFAAFIRGLFPNTNEFRTFLDNFPLIRDAERIPPDDVNVLSFVEKDKPEIQFVGDELPLVVPGSQVRLVGDDPGETLVVTVTDVQNDLSRLRIGTFFPFATSVRTLRFGNLSFPFLVTNGSDFITAVPSVFPDVKVGDFIKIGNARHTVVRVQEDLFKVEITPFSTISSIVTIPGSQILDGETFTISDGLNPAVTFEFDKDGVFAVDNVPVQIEDDFEVTDVRDIMIQVINDTANLEVVATADVGNVNIAGSPLGILTVSEAIADPSFEVREVGRFNLNRVSRLLLLTLLAKDFGITDDPTKLEDVRRGIVLHAVEYFKLKGTAKGYKVRGALEGLNVEVLNFKETPCLSTTCEFIPIAVGTIVAINGDLIVDGEAVVLGDVANGFRLFEFDKDSTLKTLLLVNNAAGLAGNVSISEGVADAGFVVSGMSGGTATLRATGTIRAVPGISIVDGETFVLGDGTNPPVIFEFDKDSSFTPGNVPVVINDLFSATDVRDAIIAAVNGVGLGLLVTATAGIAVSIADNFLASSVATTLANAINAVDPFLIRAFPDGGFVNVRNDEEGLTGVIPISDTVADVTFSVSGLSPFSGVDCEPERISLEPLLYISTLDEAPADVVAADSPSLFKYFDLGTPATGSITAIPGVDIADGETFSLADGETFLEFDITLDETTTDATTELDLDLAVGDYIVVDDVPFADFVLLKVDSAIETTLTFSAPPASSGTFRAKRVRPKVFEFDKNGIIGSGNIPVSITDAMTDLEVATAILTAINGVLLDLRVTASQAFASPVVTLQCDTPANSVRNVPITETVIDAGFLVSGMSGGVAGEVEFFPVRFPEISFPFDVVGVSFEFNPGPGADQITLLSDADLLVDDVVDFGSQQRIVTTVPGASPFPELPGFRIAGTVITFDNPLIGLVAGASATRVTRQPDITDFGDFLTVAGFDYKVVQYDSTAFTGRTDIVLRDTGLVDQVVVATRTRRRAVTRKQAFKHCRLPVLKLRVMVIPESIFFSGSFESVLKFVNALDEVKPLHVRFEDVQFIQEEVIRVPIPRIRTCSEIQSEPIIPVDNYMDTIPAEEVAADSTKVVTVETP